MTDEELRKFCLEQAVTLFVHAERARGLTPCDKSKSVLELSDALFEYIRIGEHTEIPSFFRKEIY